MNSFAHLLATTATTTPKNSSSTSSSFLLIIIVLFAAFYFLVMRPNQRKRMQAMRQSRAFDLGDEVVAGGMIGRVVRMGDGEVDVEVSDGVIVQFVPNAVQSRVAYMAGPGSRGLGTGRSTGLGTGSSGTGSSGGGPGGTGAATPARGRRNVSRRGGAGDAWPDVSDGSMGGDSDLNGDGGAEGGGGAAPSGGDR